MVSNVHGTLGTYDYTLIPTKPKTPKLQHHLLPRFLMVRRRFLGCFLCGVSFCAFTFTVHCNPACCPTVITLYKASSMYCRSLMASLLLYSNTQPCTYRKLEKSVLQRAIIYSLILKIMSPTILITFMGLYDARDRN